jgi:hypothetical protein
MSSKDGLRVSVADLDPGILQDHKYFETLLKVEQFTPNDPDNLHKEEGCLPTGKTTRFLGKAVNTRFRHANESCPENEAGIYTVVTYFNLHIAIL